MKTETMHWIIYVSGYGCFFFEGTKRQAEDMRKHKSNWEGGIGRKRPATPEEIEVKSTNAKRIEAKENIH